MGRYCQPTTWIFVLCLVEAFHATVDEGCIWVRIVSGLGLEYGLPRSVARKALESCRVKC